MIIATKQQVIAKLMELAENSNYVYRGFSQHSQMIPRIIQSRKGKYEKAILDDFEKYAFQYSNTNNLIGFLSNAQHYGLPTRLLDFTHNPLIALYFALYDEKPGGRKADKLSEQENEFYFLRCCDLNKQMSIKGFPSERRVVENGYFELDSYANMIAKAFSDIERLCDKKTDLAYKRDYLLAAAAQPNRVESDNMTVVSGIRDDYLLFVDPDFTNQRIHMQQGLFFVAPELKESRIKELMENNTELLCIPVGLRKELLSFLDGIGINNYRLMPDLPSIIGEIKRKYRIG